jgi:O-antigen/teichoic acid export membrane protein
MDRNKRLVKTTIIYFIGTFGSKLLIFFLLPLYSNWLSTGQYGNLNLLTNVVPLIGPIFTLQITETIFRFLCTAKEEERAQYISNAFFLLFAGLLIFSIIYIPIAIVTKFEYSILFIVYFITNYLAMFFQQVLRGLGKNVDYSITGIISTLMQLLINIAMIRILYEKSILLATIVGSAIVVVYALIRTRFIKYINIKLISKNIVKKMLKYSLPLIPNQISWWFNDTVGLYILRFFAGSSATRNN